METFQSHESSLIEKTYTDVNQDVPRKLIKFSEEQTEFCVGMVDIVNSTKISARLSTSKIRRYYSIFLNSMASIVTTYKASVVKNIGDSLLFYFPQTNIFENKNGFKEALDCGLAMIHSRDYINTLLYKENIPKMDFRVSMDYGPVIVAHIIDSSKEDIFGPPVNICSKINHKAHANGIVMGADMYEMVKKITGYRFRLVSEFTNGLKLQYPVYSVDSLCGFQQSKSHYS